MWGSWDGGGRIKLFSVNFISLGKMDGDRGGGGEQGSEQDEDAGMIAERAGSGGGLGITAPVAAAVAAAMR